ncbi:Na+-transporting NADH:ubiquinone oxidoreductase, subunit NqrB [Putridiphycobacter roseus]|uniref:Na+-transporting NADH:ubiquinone oxidoreductase, subunit NqrB n=1 Tax=Putridiphycobacter roseus TaxID=2219161 RepID=A0A2W1MZZ1_9FLAO|nr:RnfABCDGE type electron transport complex subunit D [Putridiphycobacter roseus]PZE17507.1 Na+-transporting NADH:ubiquinone oxidoreductase, subunit NqrB [Putridiphycobacter roseus]
MRAISLSTKSIFFQDARNYQILYLAAFLVFGIFKLHWDLSLIKVSAILFTTCLTQFAWIKINNGQLSSLKSGLITSLGLCLILNSTSIITLSLAGMLAISAKYIIRYKHKHLFNPANFGIVLSILIFNDAWISPGQWGSDALFLFVLTVLGGFILHKIGRLETSLIFLGVLFLLEFTRTVLYQGWEMDVLLHKFSSGTLLLFSFFMITDPMTIPNSKKARIIWASILAVATFILSTWMQLYTAPIWVLFFMPPLTLFFDKIYPYKKFEWNNN